MVNLSVQILNSSFSIPQQEIVLLGQKTFFQCLRYYGYQKNKRILRIIALKPHVWP